MTDMLNKAGYERLARAILAQDMGQSTETITYTPGASVEEAVSSMYAQFLDSADSHLNMLGQGMDPATFVDIFMNNYIRNGALQTDLEDIASSIVPVEFVEEPL